VRGGEEGEVSDVEVFAGELTAARKHEDEHRFRSAADGESLELEDEAVAADVDIACQSAQVGSSVRACAESEAVGAIPGHGI